MERIDGIRTLGMGDKNGFFVYLIEISLAPSGDRSKFLSGPPPIRLAELGGYR
jgi:hypothetical protein